MSEIFKEASRLHKIGFAVIWLHPKSKRPVGNAWTTGPRKSWEQLKKEYRDGYNVGVRLGNPSKIENGFLGAIDCDVKSTDKKHYLEMRAALKQLVNGKALPTVTTGRGNGSAHLYCRTSKAFQTFTPHRSKDVVKYRAPTKTPSKKERAELTPKEIADGFRLGPAWEISLYSDGRQCVLPPSIHPDTGRPYKWTTQCHSASDLALIKFKVPEKDDEALEKSTAPSKRETEKLDFKIVTVDVGWLPIPDEVKDGIVTGDGVPDRSEFLLRATSCLHSAGLDRDEILSVLTDPSNFISSCAFDHAQTKNRARAARWLWRYTVEKVLQERAGGLAFAESKPKKNRKLSTEEMDKKHAEVGAQVKWKDKLEKTKNGKTIASLQNLKTIFLNTDQKLFVKDLFANRLIYGVESPWTDIRGRTRLKGQPYEDIDKSLVRDWLGENFGCEPNERLVSEVSHLIGFGNGFHPVRDWLESLKWDGVPRINTWIKDFCRGKAPEPYLTMVSEKFLVAMVKRVFEPGCQWDYVPVLEGPQGGGKSTIARALAGDKWFMDHLPDLRDKDAMVNLQGKWLIELGELADVKRTDYNVVKQYLVRRFDNFRAPYGHMREEVPRQSVFIGTVNEGQYLKDPTGKPPVLAYQGWKMRRDGVDVGTVSTLCRGVCPVPERRNALFRPRYRISSSSRGTRGKTRPRRLERNDGPALAVPPFKRRKNLPEQKI